MGKKLSIITLTYNQLKKATIPYIESLYKNTDSDLFELIIVDNNSQDGTVEYLQELEKQKDNLKVIYNKENLGYSKGNNQGLKVAQGEYLALLNNDIILSPNWYEPLFKKLEEKSTGLISTSVIENFFTREFNFLRTADKFRKKAKTDYIDYVFPDFACVMLRRDFLEKVGYLDENFTPAYYEDDDYCVRAILNGYTNYISTQSYIYHKTSSTGKKLPSKSRMELFERNEKYFMEKYKDNPFINYLQKLHMTSKFNTPRHIRLKRYKLTSLRYYFEKITGLK